MTYRTPGVIQDPQWSRVPETDDQMELLDGRVVTADAHYRAALDSAPGLPDPRSVTVEELAAAGARREEHLRQPRRWLNLAREERSWARCRRLVATAARSLSFHPLSRNSANTLLAASRQRTDCAARLATVTSVFSRHLTLKRSYRQLVLDHHPDRLAAKGLPAEYMATANARLAAINAAYDQIRSARFA